MKTYTPYPNTQLQLVEPTVAAERKIHELQVRYPGVDLATKQQICAMQKWKPEEVIPELRKDVRISVAALDEMVTRNQEHPEETHSDLKKIIKKHRDQHEEPLEALSTAEYWLGMASVLFVDFDVSSVNADELRFKVIQEAYADFFEL